MTETHTTRPSFHMRFTPTRILPRSAWTSELVSVLTGSNFLGDCRLITYVRVISAADLSALPVKTPRCDLAQPPHHHSLNQFLHEFTICEIHNLQLQKK